ncbi:hypothetical protein HS088_TW16G00524 [Tripterygium wilfordii]|uniref:Uncharacterized protein n=1 Tax=Tripterygium wilfordii TaxID=458696 RepID=A0A7J7CJ46_TRIWF|nr:uncharacterized protein LOC119980991 [Tripterygium wilfordii]XP_038679844.1 uncharacterized protein LOC119980991 [Tripterygium wilfordii]KAF5734082.1 hypothetical protein HS088_TW16G00524 [Tripterygium wilfordii]
MSDPYEKAKGGRLSFKGGGLASRSKAIDKKKKKKKKANEDTVIEEGAELMQQQEVDGDGGTEEIYTIDAAKRRKYDDLFPVEAKKFGYDPKAKSKSVEEALDDRVKKKADRYCK